jgi:hypothetical protein
MTTALTTAALTILGGLTLLVLGQIIIRTFIDPAYELRKLRGEIANALIYHASTYMASGNLIGLSNSVLSGQVGNSERHRDAIIKALKLRISD